jgi:hypothetical protein
MTDDGTTLYVLLEAQLAASEVEFAPNPALRAECAASWLATFQMSLRRAERELAVGVYRSGPRKRQPFDARDRVRKEARAQRLRETVAHYRAQRVAAERELGPLAH